MKVIPEEWQAAELGGGQTAHGSLSVCPQGAGAAARGPGLLWRGRGGKEGRHSPAGAAEGWLVEASCYPPRVPWGLGSQWWEALVGAKGEMGFAPVYQLN